MTHYYISKLLTIPAISHCVSKKWHTRYYNLKRKLMKIHSTGEITILSIHSMFKNTIAIPLGKNENTITGLALRRM